MNALQKAKKLAVIIETHGKHTVLRMTDGSQLTWGFALENIASLHGKDRSLVNAIVAAGFAIGADITRV